MIAEINATPVQIKTIMSLLATNPDLQDVVDQLNRSLAQSDDTQSGEIPADGDNAIIKRSE